MSIFMGHHMPWRRNLLQLILTVHCFLFLIYLNAHLLSIKLSIRHSRDMAQCLPIQGLEIPWGENILNNNLKNNKLGNIL